MSLSLLAGDHNSRRGGSALPYACAGLCERDLQFAPNVIDLRDIDPSVDEPVAVWTDAAQVPARGVLRVHSTMFLAGTFGARQAMQ